MISRYERDERSLTLVDVMLLFDDATTMSITFLFINRNSKCDVSGQSESLERTRPLSIDS